MSILRTVAVLMTSVWIWGSCGEEATSQSAARAQATRHVCDRAQACGLVGPSLTYENREDCEIRQTDSWQSSWPPAECDGYIDETQLTACLATIDAIQCSDLLGGIFSTAISCSKARVCSSNP